MICMGLASEFFFWARFQRVELMHGGGRGQTNQNEGVG